MCQHSEPGLVQQSGVTMTMGVSTVMRMMRSEEEERGLARSSVCAPSRPSLTTACCARLSWAPWLSSWGQRSHDQHASSRHGCTHQTEVEAVSNDTSAQQHGLAGVLDDGAGVLQGLLHALSVVHDNQVLGRACRACGVMATLVACKQ